VFVVFLWLETEQRKLKAVLTAARFGVADSRVTPALVKMGTTSLTKLTRSFDAALDVSIGNVSCAVACSANTTVSQATHNVVKPRDRAEQVDLVSCIKVAVSRGGSL